MACRAVGPEFMLVVTTFGRGVITAVMEKFEMVSSRLMISVWIGLRRSS